LPDRRPGGRRRRPSGAPRSTLGRWFSRRRRGPPRRNLRLLLRTDCSPSLRRPRLVPLLSQSGRSGASVGAPSRMADPANNNSVVDALERVGLAALGAVALTA